MNIDENILIQFYKIQKILQSELLEAILKATFLLNFENSGGRLILKYQYVILYLMDAFEFSLSISFKY